MLRKTLENLPYAKPYLIVTIAAVVLFFPTWYRLAGIWLEFEQVLAHGLATGAIFLGLLIIHPPRPPKTSSFNTIIQTTTGAVALVLVMLAWVCLELVRIDTLAYMMLPAGIISVSWALLGLSNTLNFVPYVLLLSLSLPLWADIVPLLVKLASLVVGEWVRWFGMTALIEGNSITLPYGRLIIADGCSGIRYFAISILLAMMTSILNDYGWKGWAVTVAAAMLIGLVANWVRITILVYVAYETNMQSELLTDHEVMGWIVFGIFILPALYLSPVHKRGSNAGELTAPSTKISKAGLTAVSMAILLGPIALTLANTTSEEQPPWELEFAGFQEYGGSMKLPIPLNLPSFLDQKTWNAGNTWISVAQSQKKSSNEKLVPYLPQMLEQSSWQIEEQLAPGVLLYRNILTRDRVVMTQWYQVGTRRSLKYRSAKLLQIPATLSGESRFALITIQAPCKARDCSDEVSRLERIEKAVETQL